MVPADTGHTGTERLDPNRILLTIFALLSFIHGTYLRGNFSDMLFHSGILNTFHLIKRKKCSGVPFGIAFEDTHAEHLFFTGFECEEEAVSMVRTDIRKTPLKGLEPDGILPAIFALLLLNHDHVLLIFFIDRFSSFQGFATLPEDSSRVSENDPGALCTAEHHSIDRVPDSKVSMKNPGQPE